MSRIFFYKLTADNGGAPCVQDGLLSLAICKPMIRSTAERDDLIFGFAANSLSEDNRLIYIARVTCKLSGKVYFVENKYRDRSDRIYERRSDRFYWRKGGSHHGQNDLAHDLGEYSKYERANVLLSTDFRYFGINGTDDYKSRFPNVQVALENLGQGHRVKHPDKLRDELISLSEQTWRETKRKVNGHASNAPSRDACHRTRSCGVV